jgi:Fe-S-cluster-containing hydrogenase component 2
MHSTSCGVATAEAIRATASEPALWDMCEAPLCGLTLRAWRNLKEMRSARFGYLSFVTGIAVITEACIDTKDRACVDVCPVQCIYEFDPQQKLLFSEAQAGSGEIENTHRPAPDSIAIFGDSILYVNMDECTSCTACYQPDVCPVGAIYSEEHVPDGSAARRYNPSDTGKGHDHTFFIQLSRDVFAD